MAERHDNVRDDICDVPGILVGHDTNLEAATGCTVVVCETPTRGGVDVRGGAPGTRETDLLDPHCMVEVVNAVLLTGGSAFGLNAATGVVRVLEEGGAGFDVGVARVPIVPAAVLFDLGLGRADIRPDAESGARATQSAARGPVAQGTVGAGTGATLGKMGGPMLAVKGGVGSASAALPDGHIVGALVAVNASGDIYDHENGVLVAGARHPDGGWLAQGGQVERREAPFPGANTTIAVVATDVPMTKVEVSKVAQMAHDGLALAIRPAHTPFDGDAVFALSTGHGDAPTAPAGAIMVSIVGALAAQTLARAVVKAARAATGLHGIPGLRDLSV
jgi:L-aminopeptidase/D-esterase-like protein